MGSFILGGLVDLDGFSEHLDHMHDLDRVVGVILTFELDEPIALVLVGNFISREMDVDNRAALYKEFPKKILCDLLIEVADVDSCLLVAFVERGDKGHWV